jgi:protein tyrosine phosphatase (PTP) superfamily phosphohydrolase (DUF442 family)
MDCVNSAKRWGVVVQKLVLIALLVFAFIACLGLRASVHSQPPEPSETTHQGGAKGQVDSLRLDMIEASSCPGLHSVLRISERLYSGSEPHGDEGFASLAKLGITTVVSVDGAKPDLELAKKHGLRYVHIPMGYDGVSKNAGSLLTRLIRDVRGPIYVHCHHGRHRGPAAAAVACVAGGIATGSEALEILKKAGTGKEYAGLWRDVEMFSPPDSGQELPELREVAEVDSVAAAMATLDRNFDNLKLCQQAAWGVPADHPDLVPAQEALLVRESLHEAVRHVSDQHTGQFKQWLGDAEQTANALENALKAGQKDQASERMAELQKNCKQCHAKYRD